MAAINFASASPAELEAAGFKFIKLAPAGPAELEAIHGQKLLWADKACSIEEKEEKLSFGADELEAFYQAIEGANPADLYEHAAYGKEEPALA